MNRRQFLASAAAPLARAQKYNLMFIMTDQQRFDALSCAGNPILKTPHLDRLARDGAMFRNAMTACPVCVPARTSMLTGKSFANSRVTNNLANQDRELDPGPSFDNILHDRGYRSQYYGKWHSPYRMARTYDNKVSAIGLKDIPNMRDEYVKYLDRHAPARPPRPGEFITPSYQRPYTPAILDLAVRKTGQEPSQAETYGLLHVPKEYSPAAHIVDQCIAALNEMKNGPFSLTCSLNPPHPPMMNVEPYYGMYPDRDIPLPRNFQHDLTGSPYKAQAAATPNYHVPEHIRSMTSIYYGMVKEIDDQVGRLLRRLDELNLARNTLVVFTSDHGEMLGSHGLHGKFVFHEESVHVPLLLRLPGIIQPGTVSANPVSNMDLFSTILDYLGVATPARDGYGLRPLIEGRAGYPDFCVAEWPNRAVPNFMVRTADWKLLIANAPDSKAIDALYDLKNDPFEMRNLLADPVDRSRHAARTGEMKDRLLSWLDHVHSPLLDAVKARRPA
jgi:arylsulfatase A-like enzyme